jgi:hypothetical protein
MPAQHDSAGLVRVVARTARDSSNSDSRPRRWCTVESALARLVLACRRCTWGPLSQQSGCAFTAFLLPFSLLCLFAYEKSRLPLLTGPSS